MTDRRPNRRDYRDGALSVRVRLPLSVLERLKAEFKAPTLTEAVMLLIEQHEATKAP